MPLLDPTGVELLRGSAVGRPQVGECWYQVVVKGLATVGDGCS